MSLKSQLLRNAHVLQGLVVAGDADDQVTVNKQFEKLLNGLGSLPEIDGEIIIADDPWKVEVREGTCFGNKFVVEERISPKKTLYKARQILFKGAEDEICHHVIVKCTFIEKDAPTDEVARIIEYEERSIDAIGVQANCSPYSVELIDAGRLTTPSGQPVILWQAFELMKGDVKFLLQSLGGNLPPFLVMRLARQIAEVLVVYHAEGIVHRDIKPHNILFDQPEKKELTLLCTNFKLGDAQLAKGTEHDVSVTQPGAILGSPQYMSPEQARGAHGVTVQSDMWSLGVTLYELVTRELPHSFPRTGTELGSSISLQSIGNYMNMILNEKPRLLSAHAAAAEYPAWFVALVDRMLDKEPYKRPTSFDLFRAFLTEEARMPIDFYGTPSYLENTLAANPAP